MIDTLIKTWSKVFNLPVKNTCDVVKMKEITTDSLDVKLITEEYLEFINAVKNKNIEEMIDGCGDLIWVTIRFLQTYGIDSENLIQEIYKSNMSKLDTSEKDANISLEKYKNQNIDCRIELIKINSSSSSIAYKIIRNQDNKVLKSHKFKPPNINKLIKL